jgi:hypothetical protein
VTISALFFALSTATYVGGFALLVSSGDGPGLNELLLAVTYAFLVVGFLIVRKRPGNAVGWICLAIGVVWGLEAALVGAAVYGIADPGTVPSPETLAAFGVPLLAMTQGGRSRHSPAVFATILL